MIVVAIDMGFGTFASLTCSNGNTPWLIKGGALKSINAYYNEQRSLAIKNGNIKRIKVLDKNRNRKVNNFFSTAIRIIIKYCELNNADVVAIGIYKGCESEERNFVSVSYKEFYSRLIKKLREKDLLVKAVNEEYTSGTSFLDGEFPEKSNYNKSRRYKGLFYSQSGTVINANVNDSYQILRKAFPKCISKRKTYNVKPKIIKISV